MPFLIDGHNLIACLPDISLDDPNDEARLVNKLRSFVAGGGKKCTVVFDGGIPGGQSAMSNNSVKVTFAAAEHSNADVIIKRRIKRARDATFWTVVTSDLEVLSFARRHGLKCMRSADFARLLRSNQSHGAGGSDLGEEIDPRISDDELDDWLNMFGVDDEGEDEACDGD
jgi:predicted RNA-binding protein with PIN domain